MMTYLLLKLGLASLQTKYIAVEKFTANVCTYVALIFNVHAIHGRGREDPINKLVI